MFKRLNNRGLTAIEVLLCFSIVSVISVSLLKVVSTIKDKENIESIKQAAFTYKNITSQEIETDIIGNKLVKEITALDDSLQGDDVLSVTFKLQSGATRTLKINMAYTNDYIEYNGQKYKLDGPSDLRFNRPSIIVTKNGNTSFFKVHVGFYHPDLENTYSALDIDMPFYDDCVK